MHKKAITNQFVVRFVRDNWQPAIGAVLTINMSDSRTTSLLNKHADLLERCQERLKYTFTNPALLLSALTHASGASSRLGSNERLEFLGDAILGMVVCETLFTDYPDLLEGEMTRIKSVVVSRVTCAQMSREMKLEDCLLLGKGMTGNPNIPNSLLADVFESIVAAIYLDGGMEPAAAFIKENVGPRIQPVAQGDAGENYKSDLQHIAQRKFSKTPTYYLINESGPDHNKKFQVAARIGPLTFAPAWGDSKKLAEQLAAKLALDELRAEEPA